MQIIMFNNQYSINQAVLERIKTDTRRIANIQPYKTIIFSI